MMKPLLISLLLIWSSTSFSCGPIVWNKSEYSVLIPHYHFDRLVDEFQPILIPKAKLKYPLDIKFVEHLLPENMSKRDLTELNDQSASYLIPIDRKIFDSLASGFILYNRKGEPVIKTPKTNLKFLRDKKSDLGILKEVLFIQKNLPYYNDSMIYFSWGLSKRTPRQFIKYLESLKDHRKIFLDFEATGLYTSDNIQITEVFAVEFDFIISKDKIEFKILDSFKRRVRLDNNTRYMMRYQEKNPPKNGKTIKEILDMQNYQYDSKELAFEKDVIRDLIKFIKGDSEKHLLAAQNTRYDYNLLIKRALAKGELDESMLVHLPGEAYGGGNLKLLDTKLFFQHFWIPNMRKKAEISRKAKSILKDLYRETESGYRYHSASIGDLAPHFGIDPENLHEAEADVGYTLKIAGDAISDIMKADYKSEKYLTNPETGKSYLPELPN